MANEKTHDPGNCNPVQAVAIRLDALHSDVGEMKGVIKELATAVTHMARIEERQIHATQTQERTAKEVEIIRGKFDSLENRVDALEVAAPMQRQVSQWVMAAVWAVASASGGFLLHRLMAGV